eukprot:TRINITY_DN12833_c4_g1_i1.p1 TRINITY_DN12833_c4_g1~~TRINITY_DN12833_c4_g1_i1.p1  ORF type:complete len:370 (+),score=102.11 TRINITY_DN12833_c4_g1_i1:96-1205(+)
MGEDGVLMVMDMLERDRRMDVKWTEQLERRGVRNAFLPLHMQHAMSQRHHEDPTTLISPLAAGAPSLPVAAMNVNQNEVDALQQALDAAAKENAKMKLMINNLNNEIERLGGIQLAMESDSEEELATPAEIAWKRATALHHLPRTISEESITEEAYDWRRTLEYREAAVERRERLLIEREHTLRNTEAKESDLDQKIKEIELKDREYKLRFRGLEDREAREGNLPEMLRAAEEKQEELEQKEQELAEKEASLEAREAEMEATAVEKEPDTPPQRLNIIVPSLGELSGVYDLSEDMLKGRAQWMCDDKTLYHEAGKWVIGFSHEMDDGIVWMASTAPHRNAFPQAITSWSLVEDEGGDFIVQTDIEVTVC